MTGKIVAFAYVDEYALRLLDDPVGYVYSGSYTAEYQGSTSDPER